MAKLATRGVRVPQRGCHVHGAFGECSHEKERSFLLRGSLWGTRSARSACNESLERDRESVQPLTPKKYNCHFFFAPNTESTPRTLFLPKRVFRAISASSALSGPSAT